MVCHQVPPDRQLEDVDALGSVRRHVVRGEFGYREAPIAAAADRPRALEVPRELSIGRRVTDDLRASALTSALRIQGTVDG